MLTLLVGCVSPRSLDGLILNSRNNPDFINAQNQPTDCAITRLVSLTEFEVEGWKRITPIVKLFKKYKIPQNQIELERTIVSAKMGPANLMTYKKALEQNMLVVAQISKNMSSSTRDKCEHSITIFACENNVFKIKNSYFDENMIEIDSQLPTMSDFDRIPNLQQIRQMFPNFSDNNWVLSDVGLCLQFKNKLKRFVSHFGKKQIQVYKKK